MTTKFSRTVKSSGLLSRNAISGAFEVSALESYKNIAIGHMKNCSTVCLGDQDWFYRSGVLHRMKDEGHLTANGVHDPFSIKGMIERPLVERDVHKVPSCPAEFLSSSTQVLVGWILTPEGQWIVINQVDDKEKHRWPHLSLELSTDAGMLSIFSLESILSGIKSNAKKMIERAEARISCLKLTIDAITEDCAILGSLSRPAEVWPQI